MWSFCCKVRLRAWFMLRLMILKLCSLCLICDRSIWNAWVVKKFFGILWVVAIGVRKWLSLVCLSIDAWEITNFFGDLSWVSYRAGDMSVGMRFIVEASLFNVLWFLWISWTWWFWLGDYGSLSRTFSLSVSLLRMSIFRLFLVSREFWTKNLLSWAYSFNCLLVADDWGSELCRGS